MSQLDLSAPTQEPSSTSVGTMTLDEEVEGCNMVPRKRKVQTVEPCCVARQRARLRRTISTAWCNPWVRFFVMSLMLLVPLLAMRQTEYTEFGRFQDLRGQSPGNEEGAPYNMYWDGWHPIRVSRKVFDGPLMEIFYSVDLASQEGIEIMGDSVFIPFKRSISGTYVRDYHVHKINEFGYFDQMWMPNPVAIFGGETDQDNRVNIGFGEKLHILEQTGEWPPKSLEAVEDAMESRIPLINEVAQANRYNRLKLVNTWIQKSHIGPAAIYSGFDLGQRQQLRDFAAESGDEQKEEILEHLTSKRETLTRFIAADAAGQPPSYGAPIESAANCHHMEGKGLVEIMEHGAKLPLGKNIVTWRGQTIYAPTNRYAVVQGVTFINHNIAANKLEMYVSASGYVNVEDPSLPNAEPPTFFISPADGKTHEETSRPVPEDRREMPAWVQPSEAAWLAYEGFQHLAADYNYLFQDPSTACPPEKFAGVKGALDNIRVHRFVQGADPTYMEQLHLLNIFTAAVDCGLSLLAADIPNSHSMGPFEAMTWDHFILEAPEGSTMDYVGSRHWNDVPPSIIVERHEHQTGVGGSFLQVPELDSADANLQVEYVRCFRIFADRLLAMKESQGHDLPHFSGGPPDMHRRLRKDESTDPRVKLAKSLEWCKEKNRELESKSSL